MVVPHNPYLYNWSVHFVSNAGDYSWGGGVCRRTVPYWLFYYVYVYNLDIYYKIYFCVSLLGHLLCWNHLLVQQVSQRDPSLTARLGGYQTRVWGLKEFGTKQDSHQLLGTNSMFLGWVASGQPPPSTILPSGCHSSCAGLYLCRLKALSLLLQTSWGRDGVRQ